jgi:hypothetical protein
MIIRFLENPKGVGEVLEEKLRRHALLSTNLRHKMFARARNISHHTVTTTAGKGGASNVKRHEKMDILASIGRSCNISVARVELIRTGLGL